MELSDLKANLLAGKNILLPLVFIGSNNEYLISTYLNQIAKNNSLEPREISSINEMIDIESGMFKEADYLYIYQYKNTDNINFKDIENYKIIILSDKAIDNCTFESVKFDTLQNWQIEDYIGKLIQGLNKQEISWLCSIAHYDIYRLANEAEKLNIFDKNKQQEIFEEINADNGYADLNDLGIFNLSNAIIRKDIVGIKKVLDNIDFIDVEGTGLVTILLKNFLNVINVQLNSKSTAENSHMSDKQFKYYKYNLCNRYSNAKLVNIYDFLSSIDYRLKSGLLDMSNQQLVYYVVENILKNS